MSEAFSYEGLMKPLFYYTVSLQNCQTSFFGKKRIDKKTIVQDEQILI